MVVLSKHPSSINGNEIEDDEELDTIGNDSESEQESESHDGGDDIKLTEPSKTAIYNKDACKFGNLYNTGDTIRSCFDSMERAKEKKEQIESVKKWRKRRKRSGFANDKDELKKPFEGRAHEGKHKGPPSVSPGDRSGGKGRQFGLKGKKGVEDKRKSHVVRDSKFGFGGRKGGKKQNTAETRNDIRGFRNSSSFGKKKRKLS